MLQICLIIFLIIKLSGKGVYFSSTAYYSTARIFFLHHHKQQIPTTQWKFIFILCACRQKIFRTLLAWSATYLMHLHPINHFLRNSALWIKMFIYIWSRSWFLSKFDPCFSHRVILLIKMRRSQQNRRISWKRLFKRIFTFDSRTWTVLCATYLATIC